MIKMTLIKDLTKDYIHRLYQEGRGTYLDKQKRKFKYLLKKIKNIKLGGGYGLYLILPFLKMNLKFYLKISKIIML